MKPLFVPLKTEYFEQFRDGTKTEELRLYGARWNERTCCPGRDVTLSKGYGKHSRLHGRILRFRRLHGSMFTGANRKAIEDVYGTLDVDLACMIIELPPSWTHDASPTRADRPQCGGSRRCRMCRPTLEFSRRRPSGPTVALQRTVSRHSESGTMKRGYNHA